MPRHMLHNVSIIIISGRVRSCLPYRLRLEKKNRRNTCSAPCALCKYMHFSDNRQPKHTQTEGENKKKRQKICCWKELRRVWHGKMCSRTKNFVPRRKTFEANSLSSFPSLSHLLFLWFSFDHFLRRSSVECNIFAAGLFFLHVSPLFMQLRRCCAAAPNTQIVASQ